MIFNKEDIRIIVCTIFITDLQPHHIAQIELAACTKSLQHCSKQQNNVFASFIFERKRERRKSSYLAPTPSTTPLSTFLETPVKVHTNRSIIQNCPTDVLDSFFSILPCIVSVLSNPNA
jgi:hypothetical protein